MIICDTSGLYAAYNAKQPEHRATVAALNGSVGPLIVSQYVLTELDYLLRTKVGVNAEVGMLRDVEAGAYDVTTLSSNSTPTATSVSQTPRTWFSLHVIGPSNY